jgi:hypothetical protein
MDTEARNMTNNINIGDIIYFERDKQRYIVDGFETVDSGRLMVSTRRFIKSRNDWAKVSKCWFYADSSTRTQRKLRS